MKEIERLLEKPFDELTMGEAIVIFLAGYKNEGIERIDYIKNNDNNTKFVLSK